jgi:hypothetical protein
MDTGFRHDSAQLDTMSHETGNGARCRVRTCLQPKETCGFPGDDSQIDSQTFVRDPDLSKILTAWPKLSAALRAAIIAIVNSAD